MNRVTTWGSFGSTQKKRPSLLAVLILAFLPHSALGQGTRWIPPGSLAEDRLRIRQVMGQETTAGYLLRTASVNDVVHCPSGL